VEVPKKYAEMDPAEYSLDEPQVPKKYAEKDPAENPRHEAQDPYD
jgi:hypothetical protein